MLSINKETAEKTFTFNQKMLVDLSDFPFQPTHIKLWVNKLTATVKYDVNELRLTKGTKSIVFDSKITQCSIDNYGIYGVIECSRDLRENIYDLLCKYYIYVRENMSKYFKKITITFMPKNTGIYYHNHTAYDYKFYPDSVIVFNATTRLFLLPISGNECIIYEDKENNTLYDKIYNKIDISLETITNFFNQVEFDEKPKPESKSESPILQSQQIYKITLEKIIKNTSFKMDRVGSIAFYRLKNRECTYEYDDDSQLYQLDILKFSEGVQLSNSDNDKYLKIILDEYIKQL